MAYILSVAHSLPEHRVTQDEVAALAAELFAGSGLNGVASVFANAGVATRSFVMPLDWYRFSRTPQERNDIYIAEGMRLASVATSLCLERAGIAAGDVDAIIFVSSTGFATPTIDARIVNELGFSPSTARVPMWGLGCAAGAAGLARAADLCRFAPGKRVLVIATECCSLTFLHSDLSKRNVIAASLFGDGAAAALVGGDDTSGGGVRIIGSISHLFRDTYEVMGWDFRDDGMRLVLSPRLPHIVSTNAAALLDQLAERYERRREDLGFFVCHPGGPRVVEAFSDALGLQREDLEPTMSVLSRCGNMSSPSVLVVLEDWLRSLPVKKGTFGALAAFGPGFSAELSLLEVT